MTSLREKFAELAHNTWAGWMEYVFSKGTPNAEGSVYLPEEVVLRWTRQMNTVYADLPEIEKDTDRREADKTLAILSRAHRDDAEHDALVLLLVPLAEMVGWRVGFIDDKEDKDYCYVVIDMPSGQTCFRLPKYKLQANYRHPVYAGTVEDLYPDNANVVYNSLGTLLQVNSLQLMRCRHLANHPDENASSGEVLVLSNVNDTNTIALELCYTCAKSVENPILRRIIENGVRDAVSKMINSQGKSLFGYKIVME